MKKRGGGGDALCTCKHMSETASGAFSGTLHSIENFQNMKAIVAIHCRLAISKGGASAPPSFPK